MEDFISNWLNEEVDSNFFVEKRKGKKKRKKENSSVVFFIKQGRREKEMKKDNWLIMNYSKGKKSIAATVKYIVEIATIDASQTLYAILEKTLQR